MYDNLKGEATGDGFYGSASAYFVFVDLTCSSLIHGSNKSENQKEKTNSTLNSQPHPRHSTPKG
jgi:hypothetical protein